MPDGLSFMDDKLRKKIEDMTKKIVCGWTEEDEERRVEKERQQERDS